MVRRAARVSGEAILYRTLLGSRARESSSQAPPSLARARLATTITTTIIITAAAAATAVVVVGDRDSRSLRKEEARQEHACVCSGVAVM